MFDGCDWSCNTENVDTYATIAAIHVAARHAPAPELDKGVSKPRLGAMKQYTGESVRGVVSRLRSIAKSRDFRITCPSLGCGFEMIYIESAIKNHVLLSEPKNRDVDKP